MPCRELPSSALTGPLPERILEAHAGMQILGLELNNFTGTLPAAWAASQVGWGTACLVRMWPLAHQMSAQRIALPECPRNQIL